MPKAIEKNAMTHTLTAAADLSDKQFYAVKITDSNKVNVCDTAGEAIFGVLLNAPESGEAALVAYHGLVPAIYGATVDVSTQALLKVDSDGKLIPYDGTGEVVAIALEDGAADEVHTVLLK